MSYIGSPKKSFNVVAYNAQKQRRINQMASFETWIECVKFEAGINYDDFASVYSFLMAYEDGMKPSEAIADCVAWLEA